MDTKLASIVILVYLTLEGLKAIDEISKFANFLRSNGIRVRLATAPMEIVNIILNLKVIFPNSLNMSSKVIRISQRVRGNWLWLFKR